MLSLKFMIDGLFVWFSAIPSVMLASPSICLIYQAVEILETSDFILVHKQSNGYNKQIKAILSNLHKDFNTVWCPQTHAYSIDGQGSESFHLQDKSWMLWIDNQRRRTGYTNQTRVWFDYITISDRNCTTGNHSWQQECPTPDRDSSWAANPTEIPRQGATT